MTKPMMTAFELETLIAAEMLFHGDCPIGLPLSVAADRESWKTVTNAVDPKCIATIAEIENRLKVLYDLKV